MAKVIPFTSGEPVKSNLVCAKPLCFRCCDWGGVEPAQVSLPESNKYESRRKKALLQGEPLSFAPPCLTLRGSLAYTAQALFSRRDDEKAMREVYFLAGLMELATGLAHDVLRTDMIHRLFGVIGEISADLGLQWPSWQEGFLLLLTDREYPRSHLADRLARAETLKELLETLRQETDVQFDLAAQGYVYYVPLFWAG